MYTGLLESLLKCAEEQEANCKDPVQRQEWNELNRSCRYELYQANGKKIKKRLDKDSK